MREHLDQLNVCWNLGSKTREKKFSDPSIKNTRSTLPAENGCIHPRTPCLPCAERVQLSVCRRDTVWRQFFRVQRGEDQKARRAGPEQRGPATRHAPALGRCWKEGVRRQVSSGKHKWYAP